MEIRRFLISDEKKLFDIIKAEGEEWKSYWDKDNIEKYKNALHNSITYIATENNNICGYVRCREDDGYGVYVYDLLVSRHHRGKSIGRLLMKQVCKDYPDQVCYVMSDVDEYYIKQGYKKEGSIFIIKP